MTFLSAQLMRSVQSSIYSIVYAPNTDYVFLRFSVLSFVFFFSLGLIFLSRLFFKAPQATRSVGCRCNVFNMSRCPDVCPVVPCQHGLVRRAGKSITTTILATALVSSRLDYANSILFGCPLKYRLRLQRMQSAVARITVPQNSSFPIRSTTALLRHLHWLPIDSRISFKLSTITFKALSSGRPPYLASYLQFRAIIFYSAHVLFAFLLPPPGTPSHRMTVIVHHLLVFGINSAL